MEPAKKTYKIHIGKIPKFVSEERIEKEFNAFLDYPFELRISKTKGNSLFYFASLTLSSKNDFENLMKMSKMRLYILEEEIDFWFEELRRSFPGFKTEKKSKEGEEIEMYYYEVEVGEYLSKSQIRKKAQDLVKRRLYIDGYLLDDLEKSPGAKNYEGAMLRLRLRLEKKFQIFGEIADVFVKKVFGTRKVMCYVTFEKFGDYLKCFNSLEKTHNPNMRRFSIDGKVLYGKQTASSKLEKFAFGEERAQQSHMHSQRSRKKPKFNPEFKKRQSSSKRNSSNKKMKNFNFKNPEKWSNQQNRYNNIPQTQMGNYQEEPQFDPYWQQPPYPVDRYPQHQLSHYSRENYHQYPQITPRHGLNYPEGNYPVIPTRRTNVTFNPPNLSRDNYEHQYRGGFAPTRNFGEEIHQDPRRKNPQSQIGYEEEPRFSGNVARIAKPDNMRFNMDK